MDEMIHVVQLYTHTHTHTHSISYVPQYTIIREGVQSLIDCTQIGTCYV
jgi:hypothetical protein